MNLLTKIARVLCIPEYRSAFLRTRVAASTEHDHVLENLALDTVVDIGANRGQFALCIRRLFPAAMIFSFEPLQKPAGVYRKTFKRDGRARLLNTAIASESGSAGMHVSRWDVSSSLLPIGQAQHDNFPFTQQVRLETVALAPLSKCLDADAIQGRALLKLDIQGSELSALKACEDLLQKFEFVYVEASFIQLYVGQALADDVIRYLQSQRFRLIGVANLSHGKSRRAIQADFLFQAVTT